MLWMSLVWALPCGLPDVVALDAEGVFDAPVRPAALVPPPGAEESCFGDQGANVLKTEHFSVEWDDEGITEARAEEVGALLEEAWVDQVEGLGWPIPHRADDFLVLAWLEPGAGRSYVWEADCGSGFMPYTLLYVDDPTLESTAHHEFNHLSQYGGEASWGLWWWEATATWMQVQTVPGEAQVADQVVTIGFMENPQIAMHDSSRDTWEQDAHMYGMAVLAWFLEDLEPGLVARTWTQTTGQNMPHAINDLGLSWDEVFEGFVLAVVTGDLPRAKKWGSVGSGGSVNDLYWSSEGTAYSLGLQITEFDPEAPAPEGSHLNVNVQVEGDEWLLWLVGLGDTVKTVELVSGQDAVLENSAEYDDVLLVLVPLDGLDQSFPVAWEAWSTGPATGGGYTAAFPEEQGRCGTSAPPALWLLGLMVIRRRRVFVDTTESAARP
jgi:hypothetical protein